MQKIIPILLLYVTIFFACKQSDGYVVTSKLQNFSDSLVFVVKDASEHIDTILCKDGQFVIEGRVDSLTYFSLYIPQTGIWLDLWIENKDNIVITGNTKYPELIEVRGNSINNKLAEFKTNNQALLREKVDLYQQQQESASDSLEGNSNEASYSAKISNIEFQLKEKAEEFILKNPKAYASIILLRDYLADTDNVEKLDTCLSLIRYPASNTQIYRQLEHLLYKTKQTSIGAVAPDFEIVDLKGNTISLADFKEKYLFLTFAASWCDVCRKDNHELTKVYNKFHKKGLQMFTVSFDEEKAEWKSAAKEDNIEWTQAVDTHGWGAEMLNLYNITSIPSNFLIDKEGVIIAKNLFGEELIEVIEEKLK